MPACPGISAYALRALRRTPGCHRHRRRHARDRHRCHDDDLHRDERRAAPAAAVRGPGPARDHLERPGRGRPVAARRVGAGLPRLPGAEPGVRGVRGRLGAGAGPAARQSDGRGRSGAGGPLAGHRELLPVARRDARSLGRSFTAEEEQAERPARGHAEPPAVAAAVRGRSDHRRAEHRDRRDRALRSSASCPRRSGCTCPPKPSW